MSSPLPATSALSSANAPGGSAADALSEISHDLAALMQRTAKLAHRTLGEMEQKSRGGVSEVLEAVRLLSRLKEQCQEALARAQLSLPSEEEEAQAVHQHLEALQQAQTETAILKVMDRLNEQEPAFASSVAHSLRVLVQTRLTFLRHKQSLPAAPEPLLQEVLALGGQHRAAGEALRVLSRSSSLSGAVERVGLASLARLIDADMTQAMQICHSQLDAIWSQQSQIVAGVEAHQEQLQHTRRTLQHLGLELERAQAVQADAQGGLVQRAGLAMEVLSQSGIRALEQVQQEALKTQLALERLALQPVQAACRQAAGLKGAYGAIRGAMMSLSEREELVHTLENWLLSAHTQHAPALFSEPLSQERWESWSDPCHAMELRDYPRWMGWTFEALGLNHPEAPTGLGFLIEVLEAYCVARELLVEMEPDYDAEGKILESLRAMLQAEREKWRAWAELGWAEDCPPDHTKLLDLAAKTLPSPALLRAIGDWQTRQTAHARMVAERMQRLTLGDWKRLTTLHDRGALHGWVDEQIAHLEPEKTLKHWEELYASCGGSRKNGWIDHHARQLSIARTRARLCNELRARAPAVLANLGAWLTEHGRSLERLLEERALDLTRLGAPIIRVSFQSLPRGEPSSVVLRMPPGMEEAFIEAMGADTLATLRRAEILGLGRLTFQPHYGLLALPDPGWRTSAGSEVSSAREYANTFLQQALLYLCWNLDWVWVDCSGQEHAVGTFSWRDHGRSRRGPVHAPTGFAIQDDSDWWVHPAEQIRILQTALDGLHPVTAAMDALTIYGDTYDGGQRPVQFHGAYIEYPLDPSRYGTKGKVAKAVLWHVEKRTGHSAAALAARFEEAQPADWRGQAHDAQARALAYLQALGRTGIEQSASVVPEGASAPAGSAHASDFLDELIREAGGANPEHPEVWRALKQEARLYSTGDPGSKASSTEVHGGKVSPSPTARHPWMPRALPQVELKEIEAAFIRMEQQLDSQR